MEQPASPLLKIAVTQFLREHNQRLEDILRAAKETETIPQGAMFDLNRLVWVIAEPNGQAP